MKKLFISADSTADITPEMQSATNVSIIRFNAIIQNMSVTDEIKTPEETKSLLSLADKYGFIINPPTVSQYEEYFDELADNEGDILHISCGSEFSDAYSRAEKAARNTMVKFRKVKIYVLDSHSLGAGQALILDYAIANSYKSLPHEEIFVNLIELTPRVEQYFIMSDANNYFRAFPVSGKSRTDKSGYVSYVTVNDAGKPLSPRKTPSFATACKIIADSHRSGSAEHAVYIYGGADVNLLLKAVGSLRRRACPDIRMSSMGLCNCLALGGNSVSVSFPGNPPKAAVKRIYKPGKDTDFLSPGED